MSSIRQTEGGIGAAWGLGTVLALLCPQAQWGGPGFPERLPVVGVPRAVPRGWGALGVLLRWGEAPWRGRRGGHQQVGVVPTGIHGAGLGVTSSVAQA